MKIAKPTFDELITKEWLVTNGLGGYASGTLAGANSRRYHGLLVAALDPPTSRMVMVSKVEETILDADGGFFALSSNEYPGAIWPEGFSHLREFRPGPLAEFRYKAGSYQLNKRIVMPHGSNTTVMEYHNRGQLAYQLTLRLFLVHRDYHHLQKEDTFLNFWIKWTGDNTGTIYAHYGATPLHFYFSKGEFREERHWYRQYVYRMETARGLDDREDTFTPGEISLDLQPGEKVHLILTLEEDMITAPPDQLVREGEQYVREIRNNKQVLALAKKIEKIDRKKEWDWKDVIRDLSIAADQFVVRRQSTQGHTIIAGYHWFTDWGRDTMMAMRGLVLALNKKALAESIILTFLQNLDRGMLPNRFPDQGETPEYNTIDATLWLFVVLHDYLKKFDDSEFIKTVYSYLTEIIEQHIKGTRYQIHVTKEGLLSGGTELEALTWMDARVGDHVVTPRQGCPVEINALWYNALMIYNAMAKKIMKEKSPYADLVKKVKKSFVARFWNGRYLNDTIQPDGTMDERIRPNQIYAISLPYSLLNQKHTQNVLDVVKEKLVTPMGLRTLDPDDPAFIPVYQGDSWSRDHAYHQGTVWPFLMGEYAVALLKHENYSAKAKRIILNHMTPLLKHFHLQNAIHGVSEIFDGLHPTVGRGCIHQAWSVGMLLMVLSEMSENNSET